MANKYANLVGTNKIKDEYTKINTGFDEVETDIDALNDLVDALDSRVDTIITTPISGEAATQEIVDARVSAVKSKTFATLDARFEETEQDIATHMADFMPHGVDNAGFHNSIYRGKFLGNEVTSEQYQAISEGTFDDMYIGDYWTINGINWRIAAFNYYRNTGDSLVPGNHLVIVPDTSLYSHVMNDTNTTDGGYTGSKMYTEGLTQAKAIINNAFSGHVVTFRTYLCNAVTNGEASAGAWVDSTVDLMNEVMVYGAVVNGAANGPYNIGTEKSQLPLFALNPQSINTGYNYWLRDVISDVYFTLVDGTGFARFSYASSNGHVRPRFLIS